MAPRPGTPNSGPPSGCPMRAIQAEGSAVKTRMSKPQAIYDWGRGTVPLTDVLHRKTRLPQKCGAKCHGSAMDHQGGHTVHPPELEDKLIQAADFMADYYGDPGNRGEEPKIELAERVADVQEQLRTKGYYQLTADEVEWGARTAWRNADRCPARVVWKKLTVFDCRHISDTDGMFDALCRHLEVSTNMGNIQPAITLFRERRPGMKDVRVWNGLVVSFAGYEQADGSVIGDPGGVEITKVAESLGWRGPGGRFDLLPWVLSGEDGLPKLYPIPQKYIDTLPLTVHIEHPTIPAIGEMGLHWFTLPGVASMMAEMGGNQFTAAPFAGWYQVTEIATRDLLDVQRYNLLEPLGEAMGLDMSSNTTLWKDMVSLELNRAVLESYKNAQVSIVDHYTQAEQFMEHMANEYRDRGGCPADWVWIVPPVSGSLVPTYHQEMLRYKLSPSYEYQRSPCLDYKRKPLKMSFKTIAWVMVLGRSLYTSFTKNRKKVAILYGTETGASKRLANMTMNIFMNSFQCRLIPLDAKNLHHEMESSDISIFVTSTFGNGEAPAMAEGFNTEMKHLVTDKSRPAKTAWLQGLNYAVFGLGSSAYLDLAAFGKFIDTSLADLGCNRLTAFGIGDELKNQKGSYQKWVMSTFKASIKHFDLKISEERMNSVFASMNVVKEYKWDVQNKAKRVTVNSALSSVHKLNVMDVTIEKRKELHPREPKESATLLIDFSQEGAKYEPGDHLGLFPTNTAADVAFLKSRIHDPPPSLVQPLILMETTNGKVWKEAEAFPRLLLYNELLEHVVDLGKLPDQDVLKLFLKCADSDQDKVKLKLLTSDDDEYDTWAAKCSSVCDALREFPSVKLRSAEVLGSLPTTQARLYSIASAPTKNKVSLVIGVAQIKSDPGVTKTGMCTGLLQRANIKTSIPAFFRSAASFKLPVDPSKPVVMIAAGSGIAPFRGFWEDRQRRAKEGVKVGPTVLIFGCRTESMDLLRDETDQFSRNGAGWPTSTELELLRLTAVSREAGRPKEYVQDLVKKHGSLLYKLWQQQGGGLYVCGKVAMARGVQDALLAVLKEGGGLSQEEALVRVQQGREGGTYQEDIFTS